VTPTSFVVTNTAASGDGSLAKAILDANAHPGFDTITFAIEGEGMHTIRVGPVGLPQVTDPVLIDGYTQPGSKANTLRVGDDAVLTIELDGSLTAAGGLGAGLTINAAGCTVRGLVINRFGGVTSNPGIMLFEGGNTIEGNFIGTDPAGLAALGNSGDGIEVHSSGNLIGGSTPAARNLISGNREDGILTLDAGNDNTIQGNYVGTDRRGARPLGNGLDGVHLNSSGNLVGGTAPGAGNLVSGNLLGGLAISGGPASGNRVQGNLIGTDATGRFAIRGFLAGAAGVRIDAADNLVGGTTAAARNVISGNDFGVLFGSSESTRNRVEGNYIGTDVSGRYPVGNLESGVWIWSKGNVVGGREPGAGNLIAFNGTNGVEVVRPEATENAILGNRIVANRRLGIDLGGDGPTRNGRPGRPGPNNLQNYPVIQGATVWWSGGQRFVTIRGELAGAASAPYHL
jgi:hypothetical protein